MWLLFDVCLHTRPLAGIPATTQFGGRAGTPHSQSGRRRRARGTASPAWLAFQARLIHPDQIAYEEIRPVAVLGQEIKARAAELGVSPKTLSARVQRFVSYSRSLPAECARAGIGLGLGMDGEADARRHAVPLVGSPDDSSRSRHHAPIEILPYLIHWRERDNPTERESPCPPPRNYVHNHVHVWVHCVQTATRVPATIPLLGRTQHVHRVRSILKLKG
jgi:hypothetical protein